jgi:hypothetical protein
MGNQHPVTPRHLKEHDELFWWVADSGSRAPCTLVNFDAHSDLAMFDGSLGIGNFVSKLLDADLISEVLWVRDPRSIDFEDGIFPFLMGRKSRQTLDLACSLELPFFMLQNACLPAERLLDPKQFLITVVSSPEKIAPHHGQNWILSVDYDYFACNNPGIEELELQIQRHGYGVLEELLRKGRAIRGKEEWDGFVETSERAIPGITSAIPRCFFPDYDCNPRETQARILAANSSILANFDLQLCRGIYSVSSLSSGFVKAHAHDRIARHVTPWLELLAKRKNTR